jgi:ABC-2 type transport system ATP-binding protein
MDQGTILREGTIHQLLDEETNEKVIEFTSDNGIIPEDIQSTGLPFIIHRETGGERGYVTLSNFETDLPHFMAFLKAKNINLKHMECRRKTLDDLFVSLTGRKINE